MEERVKTEHNLATQTVYKQYLFAPFPFCIYLYKVIFWYLYFYLSMAFRYFIHHCLCVWGVGGGLYGVRYSTCSVIDASSLTPTDRKMDLSLPTNTQTQSQVSAKPQPDKTSIEVQG